jgi:lactate racemase
MDKVLVAVPDATRKAHLRKVLPRLLNQLAKKGIKRENIKIIVATGLHKPHTKTGLKNLVGDRVFSEYLVTNHIQAKRDLVNLGRTKSGIPVVLNRHLKEADSIITIGLIEPHLYAGYSGGAKTIAIGLAGEETINATHHPRFLDRAGTAIGCIEKNPFQDCLWEIIKGIPVKHSINIVNDRDGNLNRVFEGDLKETFTKGVRFARKIFEKRLNKSFDAVICKVSPPKDVNLYQASRAFNYVLNTRRPVVRKGGMVLVCASLRDGFGGGIAEKRFIESLRKMRSPQRLISQIKQKGCVAGEHRAYMVAKALTKARLGFIGPRAVFYTKGLPFLSFPTMASAMSAIKRIKGKAASNYEIPHALSVIISR